MNPMPPPLPEDANDADDSIDLMDLFLTFAENIRLLVLGPLLGGLLGFGVAHVLPQKFESTAILQAEAPVAALMTTAAVLDASLRQLGLLEGASAQAAEEARRELRSNVVAQIGRNDKLITLNVAGGSPQSAQSMAATIMENTFRESRPRAGELLRLQATEAFLRKQAKELGESSENLQVAILKAEPGLDVSKLVESRSILSDSMIKINTSILEVQGKIEGVTEASILQSPTLPVRAVSPRKSLLAVMSAVAVFVVLLLFVFTRQSLRAAVQSERQQQRWQQLRNRYGLRA